jgi:hypothetical protein
MANVSADRSTPRLVYRAVSRYRQPFEFNSSSDALDCVAGENTSHGVLFSGPLTKAKNHSDYTGRPIDRFQPYNSLSNVQPMIFHGIPHNMMAMILGLPVMITIGNMTTKG